MAGKTVEKSTVTRDDFADIATFAEAAAVLTDAGIGIVDITEFGDGFALADKATLVGKDFLILDTMIKEGDMGEYAIVSIITRDNEKYVFADGGAGVKEQVKTLHVKGQPKGLIVKGGLVRSDYEFVDEKGKKIPATTFYLNGM